VESGLLGSGLLELDLGLTYGPRADDRFARVVRFAGAPRMPGKWRLGIGGCRSALGWVLDAPFHLEKGTFRSGAVWADGGTTPPLPTRPSQTCILIIRCVQHPPSALRHLLCLAAIFLASAARRKRTTRANRSSAWARKSKPKSNSSKPDPNSPTPRPSTTNRPHRQSHPAKRMTGPTPPTAARQDPRHVQLVSVLTSVLDDHNRPAPDLPAEAFQISRKASSRNSRSSSRKRNSRSICSEIDASLSVTRKSRLSRTPRPLHPPGTFARAIASRYFQSVRMLTQLAGFSDNVGTLQAAVHACPLAPVLLFTTQFC